jgi:hypothetical protein
VKMKNETQDSRTFLLFVVGHRTFFFVWVFMVTCVIHVQYVMIERLCVLLLQYLMLRHESKLLLPCRACPACEVSPL